MKHCHHLMLGDEPHVQLVNPFKRWVVIPGEEHNGEVLNPEWQDFDKANPPIRYYGPAFEGVKSDSEIRVGHQWYSEFEDHWYPGKQAPEEDIADGYKIRFIARLKSQKQILSEVMEADEKDGLYNQPVQHPESYNSPIIEQFMSEHNPNGERIEREMIEMAGKEQPVQQEENLPNGIDLNKLRELLMFSDRYEISIQFWPEQTAVYIMKDQVDLIDYGGDFDFAVTASIKYLKRITKS